MALGAGARSTRLHAQWPRVPTEQLLEVASEIQRSVHQQLDDPELAAVEWLVRAPCAILADVRPMRIDGRRVPREHLRSMLPIRGELSVTRRRDPWRNAWVPIAAPTPDRCIAAVGIILGHPPLQQARQARRAKTRPSAVRGDRCSGSQSGLARQCRSPQDDCAGMKITTFSLPISSGSDRPFPGLPEVKRTRSVGSANPGKPAFVRDSRQIER